VVCLRGRDSCTWPCWSFSAWPSSKDPPCDQTPPWLVCRCLLIATQWGKRLVHGADLAAAGRAGVRGAILCLVTAAARHRHHRRICASIFGLFYLGFLPSHWLRLRDLKRRLCWPADWADAAGRPARHWHSPAGLPAGGSPLTSLLCDWPPFSAASPLADFARGRRLRAPSGLAWSVLVGGSVRAAWAGPGAGRIGGTARRSGPSVFALWVIMTESMIEAECQG